MIPIRTHSPPVPRSRVPNENHSKTCLSLLLTSRTETWPGMTTHDFQLNKAMNMRCRRPEQHKSKGTTNSHTGNSTSTSMCTTSSPSFSSVCRRGGEGEGALWFPVLWITLPHPAPVVPCLVVPCVVGYPSHRPPFAKARGLAWGGAYPGGCVGEGPATRRRGTIYIFMCIRIYATYLYLVV